jgi:hypothetical protein
MKSVLKFVACILITGIVIFISCKKEHSCENCKDNKPPTAIAGPDQVITLPTDSVLLDGSSSSDPDGKISKWLWTKISGPASLNINNLSDSTSRVKGLVGGIYQLE